MNKKTTRPNKVRDLVRGKAPTPTPQPEPVAITQETKETIVETERESNTRPLHNSRRGRRPSAKTRETDRHTFVISRDVIRKLRYIAVVETRLYSSVVEEALEMYISDYEKANGVITINKTED